MHSLRSCLTGVLLAAAAAPMAAVSITQLNTSIGENFDTLGTSTSDVVPAGWQFVETGSGANTTYGASPGTSSTGNTYSFGATASTDRALGSLRTASVASTFGTVVMNGTDGVINALTISFTGEQWRLGAVSRVDTLAFSYSLDATSVDTGTWIDVGALNFDSVVTSGATGALDGNAAENQSAISHTITGLNLASGGSLWLRWVDVDATGSDDGLAIDNFSIMAQGTTTDGGSGGGDSGVGQAVPDTLPTTVIASVFGGLLAAGARRKWRASVEVFPEK